MANPNQKTAKIAALKSILGQLEEGDVIADMQIIMQQDMETEMDCLGRPSMQSGKDCDTAFLSFWDETISSLRKQLAKLEK